MRNPLTKQQVKMAVERTGCEGIPIMMAKWWGDGLRDEYGAQLDRLEQAFPEDVAMLWYQEPGYDKSPNQNPHYRFGYRDDYDQFERHSIGQSIVMLPSFDELDQFLADFPDPNEPGTFDLVAQQRKAAGDDRYIIGSFWRLFHERLWAIRGMENLMMDYYDNMDGLKAIGRKLLEFYKVIVDRFAALGCDAIFTSDDLGHQTGPMMSPATFHELYFPLYKEFAAYVHQRGMQLFLHSCGDNTLLMDDLIQAGLDVFHPVQKGCMDMQATAGRFGGQISFLVGMDVQHTLVEGTPQEVRQEIRQMKATFGSKNGGLLMAMGNGIMPGTPLENIEAALDEMYNGGM